MSKVQSILEEINTLSENELNLILKVIKAKVNKEKQVVSILKEYKGIAAGVWSTDAQIMINELRSPDRN